MSAGSDFFDDLRVLLCAHYGMGTAPATIEHGFRERWTGSRIYVAEQRDPAEMSPATFYRCKRRAQR